MTTQVEVDTQKCRLPTNVKPSHYDVTLVPDLEQNTFQGHVFIDISVVETTKVITLNAQELTITETSGKPLVIVITKTNEKIGCVAITPDTKEHRLAFEFEKEIAVGEYRLEILFTGILNDQLCGFYRSTYPKPAELLPPHSQSGTDVASTASSSPPAAPTMSKMAVTQLEATDARRALPCWDEPAIKATFGVTLIVPPQYHAVSNMPVISCVTTSKTAANEASRWLSYAAGYQHYVFATTPKMSTYLLAVIVGEFDYISATTENQVEIRVYTPIGKSHLGHFALDVAAKCLTYYEKLFNIKYPLPKMDLLAIPDFAAGAMENWGAITYREILLLIDPKSSGQDIKTRVALTVCHELGHMWFGNLCTMEWWTFLYLNESFAHWIEHAAVNHIFPEWNIWDTFVCDVHGRALSLDAMTSSHAIEVPIAHPDNIGEIFDMISYAKGASVVRMLSEGLSFETFIKGIQLYLTRHAYGNAVSDDLWSALQEVSGIDVKKMMSGWVGQMGYPLVTVSEDISESSENGRVITLKQQQYFADMTQKPADLNRSWIIPITVSAYKDGKLVENVQTLLGSQLGHIKLTDPASRNAALKFNHHQAGFYRVEYSPSLMASLKPSISILPTTDRLGVLRDTFALASAGVIDITVALELLAESYSKESNYDVINCASGDLTALMALHEDQEYYPAMQRFIKKVFQHNYNHLGWDKQASENPREGLLRALVIGMLGAADDGSVLAEANTRFQSFAKDTQAHPLPGDLKSSVYSIAIKTGGLAVRDSLIKLYDNTSSQEERIRILNSLGKVDGRHKDDLEISRLNIEWCFSESVRSSDVPYLIMSIASSDIGRQQVWDFFNSHWDVILSRYNAGQNMLLQAILNRTLSAFQTFEDADKIDQFFQAHPLPAAQLTIRQILERVRNKATRIAREKSVLQQWFNSNTFN